MKTIVKNFQNELVADIMSASCYSELKMAIEVMLMKFRGQMPGEDLMSVMITETLHELKYINQGRLPYEQHANIISAKNILKGLHPDKYKTGGHL